jgi:hypothetical protein
VLNTAPPRSADQWRALPRTVFSSSGNHSSNISEAGFFWPCSSDLFQGLANLFRRTLTVGRMARDHLLPGNGCAVCSSVLFAQPASRYCLRPPGHAVVVSIAEIRGQIGLVTETLRRLASCISFRSSIMLPGPALWALAYLRRVGKAAGHDYDVDARLEIVHRNDVFVDDCSNALLLCGGRDTEARKRRRKRKAPRHDLYKLSPCRTGRGHRLLIWKRPGFEAEPDKQVVEGRVPVLGKGSMWSVAP